MKVMRKMLAAVLAVVMVVSVLLMSGCSTPKIAMTVDGREYTTGEYLAALYGNYMYMYQSGLYQYTYYGMDPWEQTFTYGDEGAQVQMLLADYLIQTTKDNIIRQTAVKKLMEQYAITVPQEDLDAFYADIADVSESEMLEFGFNKQSYSKMTIASSLEESSLFYTLYGEGGARAIPETDVRKFFDENFVAYKAITISQMDSSGNALPDADKEENKKTLQTYLDLFNESGDMDAVIEKYNEDMSATEEDSATTTTTGTGTETTTTAATTTTTVATTTTTAATTTTTGTGGETTEEEEEDPNLNLVNSVNGDKKIVEAVLPLEEGKAHIVEYTDSSDQAYIALIYKMNVEEAGGENYYDEQKEVCIYGLKFEEFDAEVKALAATLTVVYDDRAISMCDPKKFDTTTEA